MKCPHDSLKSYLLGELSEPERREVESHLDTCGDCRLELERLRVTETVLRALPQEEPPHKIAFVSDKIFEPRGWAWLWNSAPRLGFVSAVILAAAILVHAFVRPAPTASPAEMAALEARVRAEVTQSLQADLTPVLENLQMMQKKATVLYLANLDRGRLQ